MSVVVVPPGKREPLSRFSLRHRRRLEEAAAYHESRADVYDACGWNGGRHRAKASAIRSVLAEVDWLTAHVDPAALAAREEDASGEA